jgi:Dolichyl-phosphate-mannose-protein mannosyltransferase
MGVAPSPKEDSVSVTFLRMGSSAGSSSTIAGIALVLLAAALRIYRLDWQSVWFDEIFSLIVADPSQQFNEFWQWVLSDVHPPLYYFLLRVWSFWLGQSEVVSRAPSALFGVLTVAAGGVLFRPVLPPVGRLALMLLLAISPAGIQFSQEVRSYSLLLLFSTLLTGLCARHLLASSSTQANRLAGVLTIVGLLASFTHYFGFLLAAAAFLTCFAGSYRQRERALGIVVGGAALAAVFLPWLAYHAQFMSFGRGSSAWMGRMRVGLSIDWFLRLCFGGWLPTAFLGSSVAFGLLVSAEFRRLVRRDQIVRMSLSLCGLTLGTAMAISLHTPVLTSRNMVVILPAIYLVVADLAVLAFDQLGRLVAVLLVIQAVLIAWPLSTFYSYMSKAQWRESAAFVLSQPDCETATIYVYGDAFYYRYFTKKMHRTMHWIAIPYGGGEGLASPPHSACRVLVWAAELWGVELDELLPKLGLQVPGIEIISFDRAFVVMKKDPIP